MSRAARAGCGFLGALVLLALAGGMAGVFFLAWLADACRMTER